MRMPSGGPPLRSANAASSGVEQRRKNGEDSMKGHNRTVGDVKSRLSVITAIARLPPELLSEIFLHYAAISRGSQELCPYSWIRIAHVCRQWRDVALRTPRLWSHITVVSLDLMEEVIARSRQCPLSVSIKCITDRMTSVRRVLQELHRIQSIEWDIPRQALPQIAECFTGPATRLQTLIVTNRHRFFEREAQLPAFISQCDFPRLGKLVISDYNVSWSSAIFRPMLKHLVISRCTSLCHSSPTTLDVVVRALESMPLLEHLDLERVLPATVSPSAMPRRECAVNLAHLKFLRIADTTRPCLQLFDALSFSASATINLDFNSEDRMDASEVGDLIAQKLTKAEASGPDQPLRSFAIVPKDRTGYMVKLIGWKDVLSVADLGAESRILPHICISVPLPVDCFQLFGKLPVAHVRALHIDDTHCMRTPHPDGTNSNNPFSGLTELQALRLTAVKYKFLLTIFNSELGYRCWNGSSVGAPLIFPQLRTLTLESIRFKVGVEASDIEEDLEREELERKASESFAPGLHDILWKRRNTDLTRLVLRTCSNISEDEVKTFFEWVPEVCWDGTESWIGDDSEDTDYDEDAEDL